MPFPDGNRPTAMLKQPTPYVLKLKQTLERETLEQTLELNLTFFYKGQVCILRCVSTIVFKMASIILAVFTLERFCV